MENNGITVNVFELKSGLTTYKNSEYVRITDEKYNLLIMLDYTPIIGEVTGDIDIMYNGKEIHYKNVKASYMNSNNVFNLMIQEVKGKWKNFYKNIYFY